MIEKLANGIIKHPWLVILFFLGFTVFFIAQMPRSQVDPSVKNQLPPDLESRVHLDQIEELFGGTDIMMLTISAKDGEDILNAETLKRVKALSKQMERIKDFDKVVSIFTLKDIRGEDGSMIVDPAVKRIPKTEKQRQALRERLADNDLIYGSVLSKDFNHTAIVGFENIHAVDETVLAKVRKLIDENPGPEATHIAGLPFTRVNLSKDIRGDIQKFLPIGLLIMLVFLFFCFRQLRGVLLPFIVTIMGIVTAMGLIPLLGWKIQMITVVLPVILIAVANDYGIHLISRMQEDNLPGNTLSNKDLAKNGIVELAKPILATGLTTIAGLLALQTNIIIPAKQMGILASCGVAFALLASLAFIPAVIALLPKPKPVLDDHTGEQARISMLDRLLRRAALGVTRHPKTIFATICVIALATATGIHVLVVDTNPENYYDKDAPVRKAGDLVNEHFGGSSAISIVAKGDIKSPAVMKKINDLEKHLEEHPNVDITTSISKVVRQMNEVMHDDDSAYDTVPDTRDTIAQYFLLYSMSGEPDDFDRMVDFPYQHAQITARINESSTTASKEIVKYVNDYAAKDDQGTFVLIGGMADLFADLVDHVVKGQVTSLTLSLGLVALLVGLLFQSFWAGLIAALPLSLAMLMLFGLMGYTGIELNIATAMLSSIMIGVGVDYTIHFLWRYKDERERGSSPEDAVKTTLTTSGRGIVFNALSIIVGFAVLMISAFLPVRFFGVLVVICVGACLIGALVFVPSLVLIFRPRFLEPTPDAASNA